MLEIDVDRRNELFTVEECAHGDFDAVDAALQLEDLDLVAERFFVGLQHADHVFAVFFFADEEPALDVLRFPAGLDDVAVGIFLHELDGGVERLEIFVGNDVDAGLLQLFLAEGTIVFEAVGVRGAANDGLAGSTERVGFGTLPQRVVEYDDVRPLGVFFPVEGFIDEAVGNVALFFVVDVIADVVAFFGNLPGDVADQARERDEEKFALFHFWIRKPCSWWRARNRF